MAKAKLRTSGWPTRLNDSSALKVFTRLAYAQALLGQNCKDTFRKINCLVSHKVNIWRPLPVLQPIGLLERVRDKLGYRIYSKESPTLCKYIHYPQSEPHGCVGGLNRWRINP
jgi:hypothetical protein